MNSTNCRHLQLHVCTNAEARKRFGDHPTAAICARCPHISPNIHGLGDLVHRVISLLPGGKRVQAKGCGGCKARQEALNRAVPLSKKGKCTACEKSAQGLLTSEPMSNTTPPHE
jgi:hypothetical protein